MCASRLIVVFTLVFTFFIAAPAFLTQRFGLNPLMKTGDALDVLTPLLLIPLYWLLFRQGKAPSTRETILFLVFAVFLAEGHGMHLGANSIGRLQWGIKGSDVQLLTHFYDEVLGHYLWHIGIVALTGLLIWRQARNPLATALPSLRLEVLAALLYGLVEFGIVIEGGAVPLALPFALLVTVFGLAQRRHWRQQPLTAFFCIAHALALLGFLLWFAGWGGFPQFSELGLI